MLVCGGSPPFPFPPLFRHEFYFEVRMVAGGQVKVTYMLKAPTDEDMQNWAKQIKLQSIAPTFMARGEEHMLYPAEYGRYQFFKCQRDFVNKLTDISEEMRFVSGQGRLRWELVGREKEGVSIIGSDHDLVASSLAAALYRFPCTTTTD